MEIYFISNKYLVAAGKTETKGNLSVANNNNSITNTCMNHKCVNSFQNMACVYDQQVFYITFFTLPQILYLWFIQANRVSKQLTINVSSTFFMKNQSLASKTKKVCKYVAQETTGVCHEKLLNQLNGSYVRLVTLGTIEICCSC